MEYTEAQVLKAVYESGLHVDSPRILYRQWKDGIDIDVPTLSLMNFVRKLKEIRIMEKDKWPEQKEFCCDEAMNMKAELDACKLLLQKHGIHMVSKQCWCNPTVENDCCAEPERHQINSQYSGECNEGVRCCIIAHGVAE